MERLGLDQGQQQILQDEIERIVQQRLATATAGAPPAVTAAQPNPFAPNRRLMDTKIGKPAEFTGSQVEKWDEFAFKFESYMGALDPLLATAMKNIRENSDVDRPLSGMDDREKALSSQVYYALAMLCKDSALRVVRVTEAQNGFET